MHGWLSWLQVPAVIVLLAAGYTLWLWFPLLAAFAESRWERRHG